MKKINELLKKFINTKVPEDQWPTAPDDPDHCTSGRIN